MPFQLYRRIKETPDHLSQTTLEPRQKVLDTLRPKIRFDSVFWNSHHQDKILFFLNENLTFDLILPSFYVPHGKSNLGVIFVCDFDNINMFDYLCNLLV